MSLRRPASLVAAEKGASSSSRPSSEDATFRPTNRVESASFVKRARANHFSLGRGDPRNQQPYWQQGDTRYNKPEAKAQRAAIRENDRVLEALGGSRYEKTCLEQNGPSRSEAFHFIGNSS